MIDYNIIGLIELCKGETEKKSWSIVNEQQIGKDSFFNKEKAIAYRSTLNVENSFSLRP